MIARNLSPRFANLERRIISSAVRHVIRILYMDKG
jgi:hypothetical protein